MNLIEKFSRVRVLIVGDIMTDKYLWGDVERISPEAPVPVVRLRETTYRAGGAANVAANVAGLGAQAFLCGIVGNDAEGKALPAMLEKNRVSGAGIIFSPLRQTTVKTRIMAHHQQIARLDSETVEPPAPDEENELLRRCDELLNKCDILLISDYGKGILTEQILSRLIKSAKAKGLEILIDPKGKNYQKYGGATMITPNQSELSAACGVVFDGDERLMTAAARKMLSALNLNALLVTRGEQGMILFEKRIAPHCLKARATHVYDVTGAGDTVIAALAVGKAAGLTFQVAALIANEAAGLVVREIGTTAVQIAHLKEKLEENGFFKI